MGAAIIVHGGAGRKPGALAAAREEGLRKAALEGWRILQNWGTALDAVERAVVILEDEPSFNAGTGAVLNLDGEIELDASIMDGRTLAAGAVGALKNIRNPITLARRIMEGSKHILMAGSGARSFAAGVGIPECSSRELIVEQQLKSWWEIRRADLEAMGTVGAVAIDRAGHVAAAASTGGVSGKLAGRVGDSGIIGAGTYADNEAGAASCTGQGEAIIQVVLAKTAVDLLRGGRAPEEAAQTAIGRLGDRVGGEGGIILVDRQGRVGHAHNTPYMGCAHLVGDATEPAIVG